MNLNDSHHVHIKYVGWFFGEHLQETKILAAKKSGVPAVAFKPDLQIWT